MNNKSSIQAGVILAMVFFGGFANLATEIIGPRMFASMYGTATAIWAIIISVTLVGLSAGYSLGGRIKPEDTPKVLPLVLIANAVWLLLVSWIVWMVPATGGASFNTIFTASMLAFFPPSTLFGMLTPMSITLLSRDRSTEEVGPIIGNLYALSTIGSVLGALSAAYLWIPWVGLSLSLRIFAVGLLIFAAYFYQGRRAVPAAVALLAIVLPQPAWAWVDTEGMDLLAQREGYYQTVRVFEDEQHIQMNLGPTFHSRIDKETQDAVFSYAQNLLTLAYTHSPEMNGKQVLIIGGAGHALAHTLEKDGAIITEVEIDPIVVQMSDEYFGEIEGETVAEDGRVYVDNAPSGTFDIVILDAFDGGTGVPPQLSTREFYDSVARVLKPEGVFLYNFIGSPEGRGSGSYRATSTTMYAVFSSGGALFARDDLTEHQNIIFAGSPTDTRIPDLIPLEDTGILLTDDRNPLEILNGQSRGGIYFRR